MNIKIRKVQEHEYLVLLDMIKEFADFLRKSEKVKMTSDVLKKNKYHFQAFFAKTENKEIAGYVICFFTFHTWTGKALYIEDIFIRDKYRGHSVGSLFMDYLIKYAEKNQCESLNWQVLNWNESAIKFYKKLGATVGDDNLNCSLEILEHK